MSLTRILGLAVGLGLYSGTAFANPANSPKDLQEGSHKFDYNGLKAKEVIPEEEPVVANLNNKRIARSLQTIANAGIDETYCAVPTIESPRVATISTGDRILAGLVSYETGFGICTEIEGDKYFLQDDGADGNLDRIYLFSSGQWFTDKAILSSVNSGYHTVLQHLDSHILLQQEGP